MGTLYAGVSGFSYPSWRGSFYPTDAKPAQFLRLYAEQLPSVELNSTFYQLPSEERLSGWARATPPGFRFAVKMSRRITHFGELALAGTFCERVRALGDRLGPVLVQLPPSRKRDDGLLRLLLDSLDPELSYAFEFRHDSWNEAEIDGMLFDRGAARVGSLAGAAAFRYLRLREPPYDEPALAAWAERLRRALSVADVYCYFKHEDEPTGPRYAGRLSELVGRAGNGCADR